MPKGSTSFVDLIQGEIKFDHSCEDDIVLIKNNQAGSSLSTVVDDHLGRVSHVIRGEEWLPSTAAQIILYKMFAQEPPLYAHLPKLVSDKGQTINKKAPLVQQFKDKGYLP